jgi:hypothetical protein
MAKLNQNVNDLKKKLQQIETLAKKLGKTVDLVNLQPIQQNAGVINQLFKGLNDELYEASKSSDHLVSQFSQLASEAKNINSGVLQTNKTFNSLNSIAQKLSNHQAGISNLSSKEISQLKQQLSEKTAQLQINKNTLSIEKESLELQRDALDKEEGILLRKKAVTKLTASEVDKLKQINTQQKSIDTSIAKNLGNQRNIDSVLQGTNNSLNDLNTSLDIAAQQSKEIENLMGLSGATVDGLEKGLRGAGFGNMADRLGLDEAKSKMEALSSKIVSDKNEEIRLENQLQAGIDAKINKQTELNTGQNRALSLEQQVNALNTKGLSLLQLEYGFGGKNLKVLAEELKKQKQINQANKDNLKTIDDSIDATKRILDPLKKSNKSFSGINGKLKVFGAGIKSMGSSLAKNLKDPLFLAGKAVELLIKAFKGADDGAGDLAKSMNITYSQAANVRAELGDMAMGFGNNALTTKKLQESLIAINNELGTAGKLSKEDLQTFTKLREQAGMTNAEIMSMQKFSMAMGGTLKGNVEEFQAAAKIMSYQKGVAVNTKKLMADMSKLSAATKLSIGGGAKGLAEAMVQAKAVGLELEKMNGIADSLLNFESSIEAELEAELLTGKNINLEKARQLSLENDLAGAAEEVAAQVGSAEEFSKMNRIQQEAMAKAVGMTRGELADMLFEQEALKSVGRELNDQEREAYEAAKEKYGAEKAAEMIKKGQLKDMVAQQSLQERFNNSVQKLQEIFVRVMDTLTPIFDVLMTIADVVIPAIDMALQPIKYVFEAISGVLTGNMDKLSTTQKIIGGIATAIGGIYIISKAMTAMQKLYLGLKSGELIQNNAILASLTFQNAQAAYQLATQEGLSGMATLRLMAEETILGKMVLQGVQAVYNLGKSVLQTIQSGFRLALEGSIVTALVTQGINFVKNLAKGALLLAQTIARAAAELFAVSAATIGIGTVIAIAAATAGVAALYAMTKVDDAVLPPASGEGGYGKRMLVGPEGAISINDKDTIVTGTDLFKGNKNKEKEKQKQQFRFSSRDPKPVQQTPSETDTLLSTLIAETRNTNRLMEQGTNQNYDSFGTAVNTGVRAISP